MAEVDAAGAEALKDIMAMVMVDAEVVAITMVEEMMTGMLLVSMV